MYYGPTILADAGFGSGGSKSLLINTLPLSFVGLLGGLGSIFINEKTGRRASMLCITPILFGIMLLLSYGMYSVHISENTNTGALICMIALIVYLFFFQLGMSSQPWTVCSEIYPTHVRGITNSMTTFSNFLANFLVANFFLTATSTDSGKVISYIVIGTFCGMTWLFVYFLVPETKGRPLDSCVSLFMSDKSIRL
jgi:MFS transporter, SP family, galactose:H+ symporter